MVDLMKPIGSSGFGYTETGKRITGGSKKHGRKYGNTCTVKNIETGQSIFSITGGRNCAPYCKAYTGSKKFLGLDDRWYYIQVNEDYRVSWGQITSSGAVLKADRTMLKTLTFYPIYKDKPIASPPTRETPITILPKPYTPKKTIKKTVKQEDSWYKKIIQIIENLINQIKNLLKA